MNPSELLSGQLSDAAIAASPRQAVSPGIELLVPTPFPDAWHQVQSPGGYEWWYFDAEDREVHRQIVVILLEGFVFHPGYLRKHAAYLRNPTRHAPAVPRDFPCAYFVIYEHGKIADQFMLQYSPQDFSAATDGLNVAIGPNHAFADGNKITLKLRGTPWKLTWQGPKRLDDKTLTGEFTFTPKFSHPPMERVFLSEAMTGAQHHWVLANPLCDVEGVFRVFDASAPGEGLGIRFRGLGYHDHNYGTGPLGPGLKRWIWGRAAFDDAVYTFHYARPKNGKLPDEVHLVEADATGVREIDIRGVKADWSRISPMMLQYPSEVALGGVMKLSNPQLIDSAPFYMRLIYEADVRGRRGTALCEVAYPHRLRWPVLGRMIEMSITRA